MFDFSADPDDPLTLYLRHRGEAERPSESTVTFYDLTPVAACRFAVEETGALPGEEIEVSLTFSAESASATLVDSIVSARGLPPRRALALWLDDRIGDDWTHGTQVLARARRWTIDRPEPSQLHPA